MTWRQQLRKELTVLFDDVTATRPSLERSAPFVGFDESVNNPTLSEAVVALLERCLLSGAGPLWNTRCKRPDGSIAYFWGGLTRKVSTAHEPGVKEVKGARWPDRWVVSMMLGHLLVYDRLILWTAIEGTIPRDCRRS